jgi:hypothetical protein
MWESQPLATIWAPMACNRDIFTLYIYIYISPCLPASLFSIIFYPLKRTLFLSIHNTRTYPIHCIHNFVNFSESFSPVRLHLLSLSHMLSLLVSCLIQFGGKVMQVILSVCFLCRKIAFRTFIQTYTCDNIKTVQLSVDCLTL